MGFSFIFWSIIIIFIPYISIFIATFCSYKWPTLDSNLTIIEKFKGGPVGLGTIATACGEEAETIEEVYEPFLIQEGYLKRTSRGRMATELAYKHLKIKPTGASGTLFDL